MITVGGGGGGGGGGGEGGGGDDYGELSVNCQRASRAKTLGWRGGRE